MFLDLGPYGHQLRLSCPMLGHLGLILGSLGALLVPSWALLGPSWGPLGPPWGHLGVILAHLGDILGRPGAPPGHMYELAAILGQFCLNLATLMVHPRAFWALSWLIFGPFGAILGLFWAHLEIILGVSFAILGQSTCPSAISDHTVLS